MADYDELDIVKELLLEQIEQNDDKQKQIDELKAEIDKLRTQIQVLAKLADDLEKPILPLLGQLLSSLTRKNNIEARADMKSHKLQEMIEKHKASKSDC